VLVTHTTQKNKQKKSKTFPPGHGTGAALVQKIKVGGKGGRHGAAHSRWLGLGGNGYCVDDIHDGCIPAVYRPH
jgi:hypothetical protein